MQYSYVVLFSDGSEYRSTQRWSNRLDASHKMVEATHELYMIAYGHWDAALAKCFPVDCHIVAVPQLSAAA